MDDQEIASTFMDFEMRCRPAAEALEEASWRYVSSWRDWDAACPTAWPFMYRAVSGRFPWECRVRQSLETPP